MAAGRLIVLRHGQTLWAQNGQYTGRTNIPLTREGRQQAEQAGQRLARLNLNLGNNNVFVSPLARAQETARLAGLENFETMDDLAEWDYGPAEGRTRSQIAQALGTDTWSVWETGPLELPGELMGERDEDIPDYGSVHVVSGRGESAQEAAARTRRVIDRALEALERGEDVVCVAHAHILRILTTQWVGMSPVQARNFVLDTAHFSVLDKYREDRVIRQWNI